MFRILAPTLITLSFASSAFAALPTYKAGELEAAAEKALRATDAPGDARRGLLTKLERLLKTPKFQKQVSRDGVQAIMAYHIGEGGFVVKVKKGKGVVHFKSGKKEKVVLKATTVGAQIGGSSAWMLGFVMELNDIKEFEDRYQGAAGNATAFSAGVYSARLNPKTSTHYLITFGKSKGLSAGYAGEWVDIDFD